MTEFILLVCREEFPRLFRGSKAAASGAVAGFVPSEHCNAKEHNMGNHDTMISRPKSGLDLATTL